MEYLSSYLPLTSDIHLTILAFLPNLDIGAVSLVSKYWNELCKAPIPAAEPYLDIHFGPFQRTFAGPCPCPCRICSFSKLAKPEISRYFLHPNRIVRLTKHIHGNFDTDWKSYVDKNDHHLIENPDSKYLAWAYIDLKPDIRISLEFARWISKTGYELPDNETILKEQALHTIKYLSFSPSNIGGQFATVFPLFGTVPIYKKVFYCCDRNSPYYDYIIYRDVYNMREKFSPSHPVLNGHFE